MIPWLLLAPLGAALAVNLVNALTWPRGRPRGRPAGRVSVLIPARNEEARIGACVRAVLAQPVHEVLVLDDGSTDGTRAVLEAIDDPRLWVLGGRELAPGWVGKPHACQQLLEHATGDLLLFVDADVELSPEAVPRLADLMASWRADLLTAVPRQRTGTLAEAVLLPLLHLTYTSWLPLVLVPLTGDPRLLAANGQVLALRREAAARLDGFRGVRAEVVDDMALCRRAKELGLRVLFADGAQLASCRMYEGARAIRDGFAKNLYEGLGNSPVLLLFALVLYLSAFVLPYGMLAAGVLGASAWLLPGAVGVIGNLALRGGLALRHGHRPLSVLLHPLAVLGLVGIALTSWSWHRRGSIRWAGRVYAPRELR